MRELEVGWSQALSLVCEVALTHIHMCKKVDITNNLTLYLCKLPTVKTISQNLRFCLFIRITTALKQHNTTYLHSCVQSCI